VFRIERQEKVLNYINENKTVKTQELAKAFGASLVTIRNDINELANRGLIIKTHGGAVCCQHRSNMEIPSVIRFQENIVSKQAIAALAADLIEDGDVIILDSGSTTLEIANRIKGKNITVITDDIKIGITLAGRIEGSVRSNVFDGDGLTLSSIRLIEDGKVLNYFGGNRYGQYLGETPTGELRCLCLDAGTAEDEDFAVPCLEIVSMSGLQTDAYNDYVGGEIRLAYYHDGEKTVPMTGISISGKLSEVLSCIRLSKRTTVRDGYRGPEKAIIAKMNIF